MTRKIVPCRIATKNKLFQLINDFIFQQWDPSLKGVKNSGEIEEKVNEWTDLQRSQYLLTNLVQLVLGLRIEVYRADGTTQWYTAVTTNYNPTAHEYTLTDDTVLEEHFEDPRLTQMTVVGGRNVLESLLRGDNVIPRRSRSSVANTNQVKKNCNSLMPQCLKITEICLKK